MIDYKRLTYLNRYDALEIFECPRKILKKIAERGAKNVKVENFSGHSICELVFPEGAELERSFIKARPIRIEADFQISRDDFLKLEHLLSENSGFYAVFFEDQNLSTLKATYLKDLSRFQALDAFSWNLEIGFAGGASDGWSRIASPDRSLVDYAEELLKNAGGKKCAEPV